MTRRATRSFEAEQGIVPIPLRADLIVRIWGLPSDLTQAEAAKVGAVIHALVPPAPRNPERLWASDLTDEELKAQRKRYNQLADTFCAHDPDEEMGGGSPGEGIFERLEEIETEMTRRAHPK